MQRKLIVMVLLAAGAAHADDDKLYMVKPAPGCELVKPMKPDWWQGWILMFESDDTPVYSRDCKVVGQHEESYQLDPHVFDQASTASTIKVGQIVKAVSGGEKVADKTYRGLLVEIDEPGKGKKPPTALEYFGVPLSK